MCRIDGNGNPLQCSCLEKSHGQKSLASYILWGHKESDITEQLTLSTLSTFLNTYTYTLNTYIHIYQAPS